MKQQKEFKLKRSESKMYLQVFSDRRLTSLPGRAYAYMIERNYDKFESEMKHIEHFHKQQLEKRGDISGEYIVAEKEVFDKFAQRNDKGEIIEQNGMFTIPDDKMEEFKKEKEILAEKFKDESERIERFNNVMQEFMEEEITVNIYQIDDNELPNNITPELRRMIHYCIKDEVEGSEQEAKVIPMNK